MSNGPSKSRRVSSEGSGATLEQVLLDPDTPFLRIDTPMNGYEWLKIYVSFPVILMRTILTVLILPWVWLWLALLTLKLPINQPLPRWRAVLLLPVLRFWGQFLLFMGFFMIPKVKGWHNLKEAHRLRCILVFNHVSYLDALIVGSLFSPAGLAKAGVANIPFFGAVAKAFQFFFVQRAGTTDPAVSGSPGRQGSTHVVQERAGDPRYPLFAMGPEGTTKHSGYLLQFSTGAFVGGRPVTPILLKYECKHFDLGWGVIESVAWHFWRLQAQFANKCEVHVLEPYIPSAEEKADPRLYADNVRLLMAKRLGVKLSPYGIPEQQMLKRAGFCVEKYGRYVVEKQDDGTYKRADLQKQR